MFWNLHWAESEAACTATGSVRGAVRYRRKILWLWECQVEVIQVPGLPPELSRGSIERAEALTTTDSPQDWVCTQCPVQEDRGSLSSFTNPVLIWELRGLKCWVSGGRPRQHSLSASKREDRVIRGLNSGQNGALLTEDTRGWLGRSLVGHS